MTLPNQHLLKTMIIELFRIKPVWSAADIEKHVIRNHKKCTLQAIYKELRSLAAEGVVQKIGTGYTLNASWVIQMQAFIHKLSSACFSEHAGTYLSVNEKKQSWKFQSLMDADDFWAHLFLYLIRRSENKNALCWNPNLWFLLLKTDMEEKFMHSTRIAGGQMYSIIGSDCFLNRWGKKYYDAHKVVSSFAKGPFNNRRDCDYNVIGDHIITVKLAAETAERIEKMFRETTSMEDLLLSEVIMLFSREGHCTITLECNPEKAKRMRRQFSAYFGIEL